MIKDENGVYHYYHEKAAKAIEFLYSSDNEEYKKASNRLFKSVFNISI